MSNRRHFLATATTIGAAVALGASTSSAQDDHAAPSQGAADLPPAIKALTPMKDGVVPISVAERQGRLEKARRLMREQGIDALMITGGTSMVYFTGIGWGISERLLAAFIPVNGRPFLVTPKFEEERAMEQVALGPMAGGADVYAWEESEDPYALIAQGFRSRGMSGATIAVEETVRWQFSNGVSKLPAMRVTDGTPVTAGCRMVKDAHELALMRHASAVTLKAYEAAYRSLEEGMTQSEFQGLIAQAHARLGYPGYASAQTAEFSALPHGSIQPQVITEGTIILIDGGCAVEGYQSDISRTFVLGKATDKMKKVFDLEFAAQTAALEAAKPGVPCEAVDAAARKVIEDGGYGPGYKYFTHRVGHGMGMDGHEWPYLVKGNRLPLAPGMVFSDEPGIYIRGEFGVRLEDDMYITETGAELMTPQSRSLETPFATS